MVSFHPTEDSSWRWFTRCRREPGCGVRRDHLRPFSSQGLSSILWQAFSAPPPASHLHFSLHTYVLNNSIQQELVSIKWPNFSILMIGFSVLLPSNVEQWRVGGRRCQQSEVGGRLSTPLWLSPSEGESVNLTLLDRPGFRFKKKWLFLCFSPYPRWLSQTLKSS